MPDRPVFVVGCPRSGTTLLYHMLVSSGGFVNYRAETHLYDMLQPSVGSLRYESSRRRLLAAWSDHRSFREFGPPGETVQRKIVDACSSAGDVLSLLFSQLGERQGRGRWAECTPAHLLYMDRIQSDLPDARFVHMLRDGRDVALSLRKVGWVHTPFWDRGDDLLVGAWQWEWMVRRGRRLGRRLAESYTEVRFEDLVRTPEDVLDELSQFVDYELDYEKIMANPVGSVDRPNTAFGQDHDTGDQFNPVARWKEQCTQSEVEALERSVGRTLRALAYPLSMDGKGHGSQAALTTRKKLYQAYRSVRQAAKDWTPLSRCLTAPPPDRP